MRVYIGTQVVVSIAASRFVVLLVNRGGGFARILMTGFIALIMFILITVVSELLLGGYSSVDADLELRIKRVLQELNVSLGLAFGGMILIIVGYILRRLTLKEVES